MNIENEKRNLAVSIDRSQLRSAMLKAIWILELDEDVDLRDTNEKARQILRESLEESANAESR